MALSEAEFVLSMYKFKCVPSSYMDSLLDDKSLLYKHEFPDYYARITGSLRSAKVMIFSRSNTLDRKIYKNATGLGDRLKNLLEFVKIR